MEEQIPGVLIKVEWAVSYWSAIVRIHFECPMRLHCPNVPNLTLHYIVRMFYVIWSQHYMVQCYITFNRLHSIGRYIVHCTFHWQIRLHCRLSPNALPMLRPVLPCHSQFNVTHDWRARRLKISLHYISLHYFALLYITLQYITIHYITLLYTTLHYITSHDWCACRLKNRIKLHYITIHFIT